MAGMAGPSSEGPGTRDNEAGSGAIVHQHQTLYCDARTAHGYRCGARLGHFAGTGYVTRRLQTGEYARPGCHAVYCPRDGCRTKYEVCQIPDAQLPGCGVKPPNLFVGI